MKKTLLAAASLCALATAAHAQSSPNWGFGKVPTAGEWNTAFSKKQDYLGYRPLSTGGGSMTGKLYLFPSTNSSAGLNFGQGSAPGAPSNGDMWMTSQGLFYQANGATVGPISTGGGGAATFGLQTDQLTVTATNVLTNLSKSSNGQYIALIVNSNTYYPPAFTVSGGNTLNWTGAGGAAGFDLNTGDTVFAVYTATAVPVVPTLGGGVSSALQASTNTPGGLVALDGSGRINLSALLSFGTSLVGTAGQANVIRLYDTGSAATAYGLGLSSGSLNIVSGNTMRNWAGGVDAFDITSSAVTANVPIYGQLGTPGAAAANMGYAASTLVADGYVGGDGVTTSSSATFSSAGRACVAGDVGKVIVIGSGGAASAPLKTTVSSCSGANYVLAAAASASLTGAQWGMATDQSAALGALVSNNPAKCIVLPSGIFGLDATSITLKNICIKGQSVPGNRIAPYGSSANQGTTFLLLSSSVSPFVVNQSVRIDGVNFFWPGQDGKTVAPVAYPPLFTDDGVNQLSDLVITNTSIINSYDMFTQNSASVVMGGVNFTNVRAFAAHRYFTLSNVGELVLVTGGLFGPSVFYNGAVPGAANLAKWSAGNGTFLHVFGTGTPTTCSSTLVGGFTVGAGAVINGVAQVVHLIGGSLDEAIFGADTDMNGVGQVLYVEQSGRISRTSFNGRMYPNGNAGVFPTANAFDWEGTCTGGAGATNSDTDVHGEIVGASQGVFQVNGTALNSLMLQGATLMNYGANATGTVYALNANAPNAYINMGGMHLIEAASNVNYHGVNIVNAQLFSMTGVTSNNIFNTLDLGAYVAGQGVASGIVTGHTSSLKTINGTSVNVIVSSNNLDKP